MEASSIKKSPVRSHKDLIAWQASMNFVQEVYMITSRFPKTEQMALTSQMRRSAVSVPSNIAEGWSRNSAASFSYFLRIASGSMSELMTQIEIASRISYIDGEKMMELESKGNEISKMLCALTKKVESRVNSNNKYS
jgi:four helix bundle protein